MVPERCLTLALERLLARLTFHQAVELTFIGGKPEVSHETSDLVCNRGRCSAHCSKHHAAVVLTFDRASRCRCSHTCKNFDSLAGIKVSELGVQ